MSHATIGIIDYGMGNLCSVHNAVRYNSSRAQICTRPEELRRCDKIILPGVGAFPDCIRNLHNTHFIEELNDLVLGKRYPILGICLGMQVMAKIGHEGGLTEGLGWINAEVKRLESAENKLRVPHIGWNNINLRAHSELFTNIPQDSHVYFVHSYHMVCNITGNIAATTEYGSEIVAAIQLENIFGVQFHPEKSQDIGLQIIKNFVEL